MKEEKVLAPEKKRGVFLSTNPDESVTSLPGRVKVQGRRSQGPFFILVLIWVILQILFFQTWAQAESYGTASWYSRASCIKESGQCIMANGKELNDENYTVASWDYSFGTRLRITNIHNQRHVEVKVTDRGPARHLYRMGRIVDLSRGAFRQIASLERGIIKVRVEVVK